MIKKGNTKPMEKLLKNSMFRPDMLEEYVEKINIY